MQLQGVYIPLLTPMRADGAVDGKALDQHVERMVAGDVDGLVALGTTGEFADLAGDERATVVGAVVEAAAGRAPVIAGVGGVGTTEVCEHVRAATDAGASAVLALPPLSWKLGEAGVARHYEAVCAASDLPVVLYDYPALSGTSLTVGLVERVARELPQVVGIKLSGPELRAVHAVIARVKPMRPDFSVLVGSTDLVLPGLLGGADGTIAAIGNVDPRPLVDLVAAYRGDDLASARTRHERLLELLAIPALATPPILPLKVAAAVAGSPMEPIVRTAPDDVDDVIDRARALAIDLLDG